MGIIIVWIGTNRAREQLCHVLPRLVDSGEHYVTGRLTIELLDSFTKIRFDDPDSTVLQEGRHMTLFLEHGLALDHLLNPAIFEDGMHSLIVFGSIQGPVDVRTAFGGIRLELFQIVI